ncbi:plastocyanin/azurin family copper-binding protein [Salinisphaera sp.]|uniref:plastocyanin/azurin family copper-binding protein n=1 Tax=Salinisphaera sp. TaxID=1914330 RepID=UPI002D7A310E|nr:plastocyanin/azurin family copper-binding protein [Salinisphaera sp.]HET7314807.1 plastocyanin/azurin family copper-binding protein [Salinisphaera sp.]
MFRRLIAISLLSLVATAAIAAPPKSITIVGRNDLRFSKDHITVAPGQKITVKLVNKSHLPASAMSHNWVLLKSGTDAGAFDNAAQSAANNDYMPKSMSDRIIAHTDMVGGGHSDSVTFTAPSKPGDYEYICTFPGHFRAGMKGTLTVSPTN